MLRFRTLIATVFCTLAATTWADWTDFPLGPGAKNVYVSSSLGNDVNDGLTEATPKRTVSAGFALIANGAGDHLLLRRGDTFPSPLPRWNRDGRSTAFPSVLGAFATGPRPIIEAGTDPALSISSAGGPTVRFVAVVGLHFRAPERDWTVHGPRAVEGNNGIFVASQPTAVPQIVEGLVVEDCRFQYLGQGIALVGPHFDAIRNVRINRNVFEDIYNLNGHTNGVYASNVTNLEITDNVIDGVQRTAIAAGVPDVHDTSLSHSLYIQSDTQLVMITGNVIANAFDGGMVRPSGIYSGNLVMGGDIGTHHGYMYSASASILTNGIFPLVLDNAFVRPATSGIQIGNVSLGAVSNNLVLGGGGAFSTGIQLIADTALGQIGVHDLSISNNLFMGMANGMTSIGGTMAAVAVARNSFIASGAVIDHDARLVSPTQIEYWGNLYRSPLAAGSWFQAGTQSFNLAGWQAFTGEFDSTVAPLLPPQPDVGQYHSSIGGAGTQAAFLAAARMQSRSTWDERYTARPVIDFLWARAQPDVGLTVEKSGPGDGAVTSVPAGINCGPTCVSNLPRGALTLTATPNPGSVFTGWVLGPCTAAAPTCTFTLASATTVRASFALSSAGPELTLSPSSVEFGGQSMGTATTARAVSVINTGASTVTLLGVDASDPQFARTHDCSSALLPGERCTVHVTATPVAAAGPINSTVLVSGVLTITSTAGARTATLSVLAEKSLITHYYRSILGRAPDAPGMAFWSGEAARMQAEGANVAETWYSMAASFYFSPEYIALARTNSEFATDLYSTFFNRAPDAGGLAYWTAQMAAGMPREIVLVSFMISPEFVAFAQSIFGSAAVRAEVEVVGDFYRGLLSRLPDSGGHVYWVRQFRTAHCSGAAALLAQAEVISSAFSEGAEYAARRRTSGQYVGDLYSAFLRRGGDLQGVQYWIGQIDSGTMTRSQVRQRFLASPEFSGRIAAILAQPCLP